LKTYSLYELNEYLLRVIALNFSEPLWVTAEIGQIGVSQGHTYLDILQKEGNTIIAQQRAVIWAADLRRIKNNIGAVVQDILQEGMEIKIKARLDFHERYGLKLTIEDIDATYTIGKLQISKQLLIAELQKLNLIGKNAALPLPSVIQHIAIISSETAAGWQDFKNHIRENAHGYAFSLHFFHSTMQGNMVEKELLAQLHSIQLDIDKYDCIVIIRGGGAKLDLVAFDTPSVCKAVAQFPLPVFTGIGHDIDQTVLDMVAHSSLKTPTAVADFIIQHNMQFEFSINETARFIQFNLKNRLSTEGGILSKMEDILKYKSIQILDFQGFNLKSSENILKQYIIQKLKFEKAQIENHERITSFMSIESTLKRGFSITRKNSKIVLSKSDLQVGDIVDIELKDGEISSKII
jgi:exodeoxyribonuclease VII large subunit